MMKYLSCVLFAFLLVSCYCSANCDVYKQTLASIDFLNSYDFSQGMGPAIEKLYTEDAKVTASTSSAGGTVTSSPHDFFDTSELEIVKQKIDVRDIDCASDGGWCHLRVVSTYWNPAGDTVSIPQYLTYFYDPVTCKVAHYVILQHSNDHDYMVDVLTPDPEDETGIGSEL